MATFAIKIVFLNVSFVSYQLGSMAYLFNFHVFIWNICSFYALTIISLLALPMNFYPVTFILSSNHLVLVRPLSSRSGTMDCRIIGALFFEAT